MFNLKLISKRKSNLISYKLSLSLIVLLLYKIIIKFQLIEAHGRLLEPPARNTLWRFGYKSPPNYNDNELFCGGIGGITRNKGKCGICGDPYDGFRQHETGNLMAMNVTTRNFFPGSSIDLMIEIVANHGGKFNFEMCWRNDWQTKETENCFEPLKLTKKVDSFNYKLTTIYNNKQIDSDDDNDVVVDDLNLSTNNDNNKKEIESEINNNSNNYYELDSSAGTGIFTMSVDLPLNKTCDNCIFRWHWKSANNWGVCEDGSEKVGCGYQEVYRNCADISVKRNGSGIGLGLNKRKRR